MNNLHEKIEKKAYEHFISRGMTHGKDVEDWLIAEKEIIIEEKDQKGVKPSRRVSKKRHQMS